ncbi:dihydroneopterin aldolase [Vulcanococcus limneticus]|uniref:dihydroneopterin aldolase n=1 Tax=Vulcanococcus limneticus TaxID=2170428 RepID=UPI00398BD60E
MIPAAAPGSAPQPPADRILVRDLRLWAHVGVLEPERQLGQWFELDLELAVDLAAAGAADALELSLDYSRAITALQQQARTVRCLTLEHYAERILTLLEELYGPVPMRLELRKCRAPVPGFTGTVAVRRSRHGQGVAW